MRALLEKPSAPTVAELVSILARTEVRALRTMLPGSALHGVGVSILARTEVRALLPFSDSPGGGIYVSILARTEVRALHRGLEQLREIIVVSILARTEVRALHCFSIQL